MNRMPRQVAAMTTVPASPATTARFALKRIIEISPWRTRCESGPSRLASVSEAESSHLAIRYARRRPLASVRTKRLRSGVGLRQNALNSSVDLDRPRGQCWSVEEVDRKS